MKKAPPTMDEGGALIVRPGMAVSGIVLPVIPTYRFRFKWRLMAGVPLSEAFIFYRPEVPDLPVVVLPDVLLGMAPPLDPLLIEPFDIDPSVIEPPDIEPFDMEELLECFDFLALFEWCIIALSWVEPMLSIEPVFADVSAGVAPLCPLELPAPGVCAEAGTVNAIAAIAAAARRNFM